MAENKKSFLLYCDLIHTVKKMPKEKAGELFLIILQYVNDENPIIDDILIDLVFEPIKQQFKRDLEKYRNTIERNKKNGAKGGRPKNPIEPKKPSGLFNNPTKPKKADNDKDKDKDKDNDNVKEIKISIYDTFDFFKNEFKDIWINEFIPLKKKKKAVVTDRALKSQLEKIRKLSGGNFQIALQILEKSVNSGWTDFYELKNNTASKENHKINNDIQNNPDRLLFKPRRKNE